MITVSIGGQGDREKLVRKKGKNLLDFPDNYVVLDLETTGLDPYYDSIIEVAGIKYELGEESDRFQELVDPKYDIDNFITNLTGITNDMLKEARHESDVVKEFYDFIGESIIVAHNAHFDINFIYDSLYKYHNIEFDNDFVDVLRLSRRLLPELDHHRLVDLSAYFGYDDEGSHRAEYDAELAAKIYSNLQNLVIEKYGSVQEFIENTEKSSSSVKAKDFKGDESKHQKDNLLYGKVCVITGKLDHLTRKEAMQVIADIGGINGDNVTKKTNYLILGNFDYLSNIKGKKTNKLKKAENYILEGQELEIISENIFYELVNEYNRY